MTPDTGSTVEMHELSYLGLDLNGGTSRTSNVHVFLMTRVQWLWVGGFSNKIDQIVWLHYKKHSRFSVL